LRRQCRSFVFYVKAVAVQLNKKIIQIFIVFDVPGHLIIACPQKSGIERMILYGAVKHIVIPDTQRFRIEGLHGIVGQEQMDGRPGIRL
jgi:hypothetical protein